MKYLLLSTRSLRRKKIPAISKVYVFLSLLAVSFVIYFYIIFVNQTHLISQQLKLFQRTLFLNDDNLNFLKNNSGTEDEWKFIGDPQKRFQIFSAFFDSRLEIVGDYGISRDKVPIGSVRILSILSMGIRKSSVNCNLKYKGGIITERAHQVNFIHENFGLPFSATFVVCTLTQNLNEQEVELPSEVGLTYDEEISMRNVTSFVKIRYPKFKHNSLSPLKQRDNLAVCVGPAHNNFDNALRVVEFVEMYKLLGATKFYLYNCSISGDVDKVFQYYQDQGVAQIMNWTLNGYKFEVEVRYGGIFAALNDCIYRSTIVDNFKYTAVVDFDEILMPLNSDEPNLLEFVRKHDESSINSFLFQNVFFFKIFDGDFSTVPAGAANKFLYTQVQTTRTSDPFPYGQRSKYIAKGRLTIELGNHRNYESLPGTGEHYVEASEGLSFHYRDHCVHNYCTLKRKVDFSARVYGEKLWKRVDEICGNLFSGKVCPLNNWPD